MATAAQLGGKSNCLLLALVLDYISLNICCVLCISPDLQWYFSQPGNSENPPVQPSIKSNCFSPRFTLLSSFLIINEVTLGRKYVLFISLKKLPFGCNKVGQCMINEKVITKVKSNYISDQYALVPFQVSFDPHPIQLYLEHLIGLGSSMSFWQILSFTTEYS